MSWYQDNREHVKAYAKVYNSKRKAMRNEVQRQWRKRTRAERLIALDRKITLAEARIIVQQMERKNGTF